MNNNPPTKAEVEVLLLMIQGLDSTLIARRLKRSLYTVKGQRAALLDRTRCRNACQLGYWAARNGYEPESKSRPRATPTAGLITPQGPASVVPTAATGEGAGL